MARPNSPDMPPKRNKKVRLGINIAKKIRTFGFGSASAKKIDVLIKKGVYTNNNGI